MKNNKDENFTKSKDTVNRRNIFSGMAQEDPEQLINNKEIFGDGTGDWPEDFPYENGNYTCRCRACKKMFMGNKHRFVCKTCACEEIIQEYERLLSIEKKYKELDKWYWDRPL